VKNNFRGIRSNLAKMAPAFYASELMIKTAADEQPNVEAFHHLIDFLAVLNAEDDLNIVNVSLNSFTLKLLACIGFSSENVSRSFKISPEMSDLIQNLRQKEFVELKTFEIPNSLTFRLRQTINQLLEFVLEREMKSEAFLAQLK
jgi:hypothetical protein